MKTINLDRQFLHAGKSYGPGEVEVSDEIAADLTESQARVQKQDAEYRASRLGDLDAAQRAARGEAPAPVENTADQVTYTKAAAPEPQRQQKPTAEDLSKELHKLKKDDLLDRAEKAGVEVKDGDTKDVIVDAIVKKLAE